MTELVHSGPGSYIYIYSLLRNCDVYYVMMERNWNVITGNRIAKKKKGRKKDIFFLLITSISSL
jgi:hypothetical protein